MKCTEALVWISFFIGLVTGQPFQPCDRFVCPLSSLSPGEDRICFGVSDICAGGQLQVPSLCNLNAEDTAYVNGLFTCKLAECNRPGAFLFACNYEKIWAKA